MSRFWLASVAIVFASVSSIAIAQEATIEPLGYLTQNYRSSTASRVSDDGSVIVGWSNWTNADSERGFRWTADGGMQGLAPTSGNVSTRALGLSADGEVVVGYAEVQYTTQSTALKWNSAGVATSLHPTGYYMSAVHGMSGDATAIVGEAAPTTYHNDHAYRFNGDGTAVDLGTLNGYDGRARNKAVDASGDGSVIVGEASASISQQHAFRWTPAEGLQSIGRFPDAGAYDSSSATAVSDDGHVIVGWGYGSSGPRSGFRAFGWTQADGMVRLPSVLDSDHQSRACDVSADGAVIVGDFEREEIFGVDYTPEACIWRNGDATPLEEILKDVYGVDMTGWASLTSITGCSANGRVLAGTGVFRGDQTAFRVVLGNLPPTVESLPPIVVECDGETNLVSLAATVDDDDASLDVTWKIGDEVVQIDENVVPGSTVEFEYDFPDGESVVTVEVSDGELAASTSTTVTVEDTTAPSIVVAKDVTVGTDPGKAFSTNVRLKTPTVVDICDGDPAITNNAPAKFPVGLTKVVWTAIDADGNRARATQRIIVEDREKPTNVPGDDVTVSVDRGQTYAKLRLSPPKTGDNVTLRSDLKITNNAPKQFPVGVTVVTWTVKDEAGNRKIDFQNVTVTNAAPKASAGKNLVVDTESLDGIEVALDGSASSDADGHELTYLWTAEGVEFVDPTAKKPSGLFPVGKTTVTLQVADEVGASAEAEIAVDVRYRGVANESESRLMGSYANWYAQAALEYATTALSQPGGYSDAGISAYSYAYYASVYADLAGDSVEWGGDVSQSEAFAAYFELRYSQFLYDYYATVYAESRYYASSDDAALYSYLFAYYAQAYAGYDLGF